ncbi:carotenoid biosynthesis protein [Rhodococcus sp. NPDC079359]|uniref:carotenoid biosynthesis protein n=1 Tax=unclassified Rhodococcus (in: high G+C Gram-positive bacteria) TaxID=192944 RepID=UPI002954769B|nr:carotenoid biosynthesis protein [Rhodococcus sp. IEGM 1370]MDV8076335.1 carotenoid biosynthesis protein [Rhodococcus sp. IEGM 1370]
MKVAPIVVAAAAVGCQILYPLVSGSTRDVVTVAVVALLALASILHAALNRGVVWATILVVVTAGTGFASELVGTATGIPFGEYFYAQNRLGPSLFEVPVVVPLAWTAGFYPIWCAVTFVVRRLDTTQIRATALRIVAVAVGMVGWDLYLDPQMVTDGQWTWTAGSAGLPGVPSIPLTNYLGWLVVATLMAAVMESLDRAVGRPQPSDDAVPIGLFLWTWLGSALAHAVFLDGPELRYSAVYGFVVMGLVGIPLLWIARRDRPLGAGPRAAVDRSGTDTPR